MSEIYYCNQDVLEALYLQCKNREVFLRGTEFVSSRPLSVSSSEELRSLIERYAQNRVSGVFASIEVFSNPLDPSTRTSWDLAIDLDGEHLDHLKKCVLNVAGVLQIFKISCLKIKFSGRRGFHIVIPGAAFDIFMNDSEFIEAYPNVPRAICRFIEASLRPDQKKMVTFDYDLYQTRRVLRLAYSLHEETGLVSLPLSLDQISTFKPEDALPSRVEIDYKWLKTDAKIGEAWDLMEATSKWLKRCRETPAVKVIRHGSKVKKTGWRTRWIEQLLKNPVDDGRHRILWLIVAPYLVNVKHLSPQEAEREALNYLEQCDKVRRIQGGLRGLARYYVRRSARIGLKPLSLLTMKERYPNLYAIIQKTLKI